MTDPARKIGANKTHPQGRASSRHALAFQNATEYAGQSAPNAGARIVQIGWDYGGWDGSYTPREEKKKNSKFFDSIALLKAFTETHPPEDTIIFPVPLYVAKKELEIGYKVVEGLAFALTDLADLFSCKCDEKKQ